MASLNYSVSSLTSDILNTLYESSLHLLTEVEAEDEHLKAEHSQLQQEVDGMIIAVSKKRKHCPHQTVVQLANTCRAQCSYVVSIHA